VTVPVPLPVAPWVIVSQSSLLTAVQLQSDALTDTILVEVPATTLADDGEMVALHGTPA
jgi:hypothetical protein